MTNAWVKLWGSRIAAVTWQEDRDVAVFQYTPEFALSGIEVAPLMMPLRRMPYTFPALPKPAFRGLPGLLSDSLPDKFGSAIIDAWLAEQGRAPSSFNPVERLCYVGRRGIGALEFEPALLSASHVDRVLDVAALAELAASVQRERDNLAGVFAGVNDRAAIEDILRVGTSAGGARAKAIVAWNRATGEFRSGQIEAGSGFEYWLIKFDGVDANRDRELADPEGYGLVEYAYALMAAAAGITMTECRVHREGGRAHFMTKRFDRIGTGGKQHMQSLGALRHFDFNQAGAYSYEQIFDVIRRLQISMADAEEQFARAVFNVTARNRDDHVKNVAFLMSRDGRWRLSPAFDMTYAWNPRGPWTSRHQMTINGRREGITQEDLLKLADRGDIKRPRAKSIMARVSAAVAQWPRHAEEAGVPGDTIRRISAAIEGPA